MLHSSIAQNRLATPEPCGSCGEKAGKAGHKNFLNLVGEYVDENFPDEAGGKVRKAGCNSSRNFPSNGNGKVEKSVSKISLNFPSEAGKKSVETYSKVYLKIP